MIQTNRKTPHFQLCSSSLLRMGQSSADSADQRSKQSVYLLLEMICDRSAYLSDDLLESCFPYVLLRSSVHHCYLIDANTAKHAMHEPTSRLAGNESHSAAIVH